MVICSLLGVAASWQSAHAATVCEASSLTYPVSPQVPSTTVDPQMNVLIMYEECDATRIRGMSNKDRPIEPTAVTPYHDLLDLQHQFQTPLLKKLDFQDKDCCPTPVQYDEVD